MQCQEFSVAVVNCQSPDISSISEPWQNNPLGYGGPHRSNMHSRLYSELSVHPEEPTAHCSGLSVHLQRHGDASAQCHLSNPFLQVPSPSPANLPLAQLHVPSESPTLRLPTTSRQPDPRFWHQPSHGVSVAPVQKWILRTGGMTFLASNLTGLLSFLVLRWELEWAVFTMLKLECLLAHLAWYWISVEDHIRETTDEMLVAAMKWTLSWSVWPQQLRSWAHQL
jgi:hypothetical protein